MSKPEDHDPADCDMCQGALQPMDATGAGRTWPVVNLPGLDAWLRRIEPDDAPEPTDAPSEARTGPVAENRPWLAHRDNHPANGAGEGQA